MSMQPISHDERFEFDKADRLRRAMRVSGVGVSEMAEHLEVSSNTIGNWISGRATPRKRDMRAFALRTGFPIEWLETGRGNEHDGHGPDDGGVTARYRFGHNDISRRAQRLRGSHRLSPTGQQRLVA